MKILKNSIQFVLSQLFPEECVSCGKVISSFEPGMCGLCEEFLNPISEKSRCEVCGIPIETFSSESFVCSDCRKSKPFFDSVFSLFQYGGSIRSAILNYKFKGKVHYYKFFSRLMFEKVEWICKTFDIDFIIPVPVHWKRFLKRGFGHVFLIVYGLKKTGHLPPVYSDVIKKSRHTKPLWGLSRDERKGVVRGAFVVKRKGMIARKNILVVDDIITTGATLNEIARVLKKDGAKKVYGVTICREVI